MIQILNMQETNQRLATIKSRSLSEYDFCLNVQKTELKITDWDVFLRIYWFGK